jgi:hypothetical protein
MSASELFTIPNSTGRPDVKIPGMVSTQQLEYFLGGGISAHLSLHVLIGVEPRLYLREVFTSSFGAGVRVRKNVIPK